MADPNEDRAFQTMYPDAVREREFLYNNSLDGMLRPDFNSPVGPQERNVGPALLNVPRTPDIEEPTRQSKSQNSVTNGDFLSRTKGFLNAKAPAIANAVGSGLALLSGNPGLLQWSLGQSKDIQRQMKAKKQSQDLLTVTNRIAEARMSGNAAGALQLMREEAARTDLEPEVAEMLGKMILSEAGKVQVHNSLVQGVKLLKSNDPMLGISTLLQAGVPADLIKGLAPKLFDQDTYQTTATPDGAGFLVINKRDPKDREIIMLEPGGEGGMSSKVLASKIEPAWVQAAVQHPEFNKFGDPLRLMRKAMAGDPDAMRISREVGESIDTRKNPEDDFDRATVKLTNGKFKTWRDLNAKAEKPEDFRLRNDVERLALQYRREAASKTEVTMQQEKYMEMPIGKMADGGFVNPTTGEVYNATMPWAKVSDMREKGARQLTSNKEIEAWKGTHVMDAVLESYDRVAKDMAKGTFKNFGQYVKEKGKQAIGIPGMATTLDALEGTTLFLGRTFQGAASQLSNVDVASVRNLMPRLSDTSAQAQQRIAIGRRFMGAMRRSLTGDAFATSEMYEMLHQAERIDSAGGQGTINVDGVNVVVPGAPKKGTK